jgi:hypothetical protein
MKACFPDKEMVNENHEKNDNKEQPGTAYTGKSATLAHGRRMAAKNLQCISGQ